jgi:putative membrane protein
MSPPGRPARVSSISVRGASEIGTVIAAGWLAGMSGGTELLEIHVDTDAKRWTLGVFVLLVAITWWRPIYPAEQALHHSLTVVALVALILVNRARPLPYSSFLLILIFLALHSVAARWIYSFVPYDDWTDALFGVRINELFGWRRNNFDRLVHLSYGLCLGPVLFRALRDRRGLRRRTAALTAVEIILSTSALYELFEWAIAMTLAPGAAEAYNGQQGDLWDAHKDMAIATLGAIAGVAIAMRSTTQRFGTVAEQLPEGCRGQRLTAGAIRDSGD